MVVKRLQHGQPSVADEGAFRISRRASPSDSPPPCNANSAFCDWPRPDWIDKIHGSLRGRAPIGHSLKPNPYAG